jgi:hypothetical protein
MPRDSAPIGPAKATNCQRSTAPVPARLPEEAKRMAQRAIVVAKRAVKAARADGVSALTTRSEPSHALCQRHRESPLSPGTTRARTTHPRLYARAEHGRKPHRQTVTRTSVPITRFMPSSKPRGIAST